MSKQDTPRRKRRWLIVVAAVLIVAVLATLTVVRFWPKDQSTHTEDTRDIWDFVEPAVSSDGTYATIETDHLSFWTVLWVNVTDEVYAFMDYEARLSE